MVTGISLIVSAIGIMNVMFVSVRERTKEIGLRKAMGATNNDILVQFLSEAVIISIIGGTIGIGLVKLVTVALSSSLATTNGINFPIDFDLLLIFYTFMICLFIGVTSGILPARTAANLHPIDALRHE
jgi:putative ABC transport system permease protein